MKRRWLRWSALAACFVALPAGAVFAWLKHGWFRTQPAETAREIAPGVRYERRVKRDAPFRVAHIATVDLDRAEVEFWTTAPADPGAELPFRAQTTSAACREAGLLVCVNGDHFAPFHADALWNWGPKIGEAASTRGPAVAAGKRNEPRERGYFAKRNCAISVTADGRFLPGVATNAAVAISGGPFLVSSGRAIAAAGGERGPRTCIAYSNSRRRFWMVVIDGRQPRYSEGATDAELAELTVELGAEVALRMDGGGSSAMAGAGDDGRTALLSSPIQLGIPGRERPVANHWGIRGRTK